MPREISALRALGNSLRKGEDPFDRRLEQPRENEGEAEARLESAGLDRIDGLAGHSGKLGQALLRQSALTAQLAQPRGHSHVRRARDQNRPLTTAKIITGAKGSIGGAILAP
jgi:hypothetical protein